MSKNNISNIAVLRKQIDTIDNDLLNLLHKRLSIVNEIKKYKKNSKINVFSSEREAFILKKIIKNNKNIFPQKSLLKIYNEIFSVSRKFQQELRIGFLGPEGTFSHTAAENIFGTQSNYIPLNSIMDIFAELDSEQIDHGVVPIENSYEGIVGYTLDMLIEYSHYIIKEFYLEITNNIISKENSIKKIEILYSHPQSLGQCRIFIQNSLKNVKIIETSSTSEAARLSSLRKNSAAIASKEAAGKYHLTILAENINDSLNNYTRFIVLSKQPNKLKENIEYKTSLIVGVKDKPGALFSILEPFKKHHINMTKIESRPTKKKAWEYIFLIEFEGEPTYPKIKKMMSEIEQRSTYIKTLGSYPKFIQ